MSDLSETLDRTRAFLTRYVVFAKPEQADGVTLWVGHTWTYDQFDVTPYLAVQSPEKRSGKSRLLECLRLVARAAVPMAGASLAALFRIIDQRHPTLLLDEADTIFNKRTNDSTEDIRGLLNNGYRRGTPFYRVVGEGTKMHVEDFDVFCPKAIASIRALPDTVQDRSIVVSLKRRARSEPVARFRFRMAEQEATVIREWWESLAKDLPEEADVPEQLDDRAADSWEPLLALADQAGGDWPERARRAALVLSGEAEPEDESQSVMLLYDIRDILTAEPVERISTADLIKALHAMEERPWGEDYRHGKPLRAEGLAYLLRPWKLRSRQMKINGVNVKGYESASFADAFERYLSPLADDPDAGGPDRADGQGQGGATAGADERPKRQEELFAQILEATGETEVPL
jgi:hypothetical protein